MRLDLIQKPRFNKPTPHKHSVHFSPKTCILLMMEIRAALLAVSLAVLVAAKEHGPLVVVPSVWNRVGRTGMHRARLELKQEMELEEQERLDDYHHDHGAHDKQMQPGGGGGGTTVTHDFSTGFDTASPTAGSLLGSVGYTAWGTADLVGISSAIDSNGGILYTNNGLTLNAGEDIYGPFEAGFGTQQNNVISGIVDTTSRCDSQPEYGYLPGGLDTKTSDLIFGDMCQVTMGLNGNEFVSLVDYCGGHTQAYHFHERMWCLYDQTSTGHSTAIGFAADGQVIYGANENGPNTPPQLDACGGHFGVTPDSQDEPVYHYHVQDAAPFTVGCFGPDMTSAHGLVTTAKCRSLYATGNGCSDTTIYAEGSTFETRYSAASNTDGIFRVDTASQDYLADLWCPCHDGAGSNVDAGTYTVGGVDYTVTFTRRGIFGNDAESAAAASVTTKADVRCALFASTVTGGSAGANVQRCCYDTTAKTGTYSCTSVNLLKEFNPSSSGTGSGTGTGAASSSATPSTSRSASATATASLSEGASPSNLPSLSASVSGGGGGSGASGNSDSSNGTSRSASTTLCVALLASIISYW